MLLRIALLSALFPLTLFAEFTFGADALYLHPYVSNTNFVIVGPAVQQGGEPFPDGTQYSNPGQFEWGFRLWAKKELSLCSLGFEVSWSHLQSEHESIIAPGPDHAIWIVLGQPLLVDRASFVGALNDGTATSQIASTFNTADFILSYGLYSRYVDLDLLFGAKYFHLKASEHVFYIGIDPSAGDARNWVNILEKCRNWGAGPLIGASISREWERLVFSADLLSGLLVGESKAYSEDTSSTPGALFQVTPKDSTLLTPFMEIKLGLTWPLPLLSRMRVGLGWEFLRYFNALQSLEAVSGSRGRVNNFFENYDLNGLVLKAMGRF